MTQSNERIERLQGRMVDEGLDFILCFKPQNSFYLSNFNPVIYSHPVIAILPKQGDPILLVHALRDDHARESSWVNDIRLFGSWSTKKTMGEDWTSALKSILKELDADTSQIGIEGDFLPVATHEILRNAFPDAQLRDASSLIYESRLVKTPDDLTKIRAASRIADVGMEAAIQAASERCTEREVSIRAVAAMNEFWSKEFPEYEVADFGSLEGGIINGLWCWVLTGDRIFMNCDVPTTRTLKDGELALIIIWTNCDGMHAENERTVAVGTQSDEVQAVYDTVLKVREEARHILRPGVSCAEAYAEAQKVYEREGYGEFLPGRIGHGMGLGAHESPSLSPYDHTVLEPGMVLTFEPNLRVPNVAGMQHSDTIIITEEGHEIVTQTKQGLIQV